MKITKEKGITLIALVITIIVLLILAGVSISSFTGQNSIIGKAKNAKEQTQIATEKEAIQLTMINKEATGDSKYDIGEELRDRTIANGDNWKIVSVNETGKIYGTNCYYIPKGVELENYGQTKHEWVVDNNSGEIVALPEGEYIKLAYGDNLAVTDGIILNVDPINMSDENSWGEGVTLYGVTPGDGYGYNGTEIKFDGVDDYIEVYAKNSVNMENGITLEFYGKSEGLLNLLAKTLKGNEDRDVYFNMFRTQFESKLSCCMSNNDCGSEWVMAGIPHWIEKQVGDTFKGKEGGYLTLSVDAKNNIVSVYWKGKFIDSTKCNHDWIVGGGLINNEIPFTIGLMVGDKDGKYNEFYSKMDLYACRLYNKVLTEEEVNDNYNKTVAYHNLLIQQGNN